MFCIPKILKNESNSQRRIASTIASSCCFVSQRYWKMKAIHNYLLRKCLTILVVLYPKDTEKWKQFTTFCIFFCQSIKLFCIPKILKNESNSQPRLFCEQKTKSCFVSQRYWKMKAIHNVGAFMSALPTVVLYPKDTEKWKQFTTN